MRIGLTGGAGFIGANLARRLLAAGADVTIIDDLSTGYLHNIDSLGVEFVEGSILDDAALQKALQGCEAVVHLAALGSVPRSVKAPLPSHEINATGTLRVLEAARSQNAHVIFSSSSSVYGANPELPKVESMRPMPVSPYAVSKLAAESYTLSYQRVYGLPTLAFRFFNVFGPLQAPGHAYAAVIPAFTYAALRGEPLVIHGDGKQTRDFTYVGTVVETITSAIERRVTSLDPVNLAFGTRYSLLDVIDRIGQQIGATLEIKHVEPRAGDVRDSQADSSTLKALFPDIHPTDLNAGLAETITWMKSRTTNETRS
jgi:UDP-glucose 4-epimerase